MPDHSNDGTGNSAFVRYCEHLFFGHRGLYIVLCALLTVLFGWKATQLKLDASFEKQMPTAHDYVTVYNEHKADLDLPNDLRLAVENTRGDIFDPAYLEVLRKITDEAMFLPGVDKSKLQSLWTANVRWTEVTSEGFNGGEIIAPTYDGSQEQIDLVRQNVYRSDTLGRLVADNYKSSVVYIPLVKFSPDSGQRHDYIALGNAIEALRTNYQKDGINIYVVGYGKKMHDMLSGALAVASFFFVAVALTFALMWWDTRCLRSSIMIIVCSLIAVVWQMGILVLLGQGVDTYSMLIPFLVFAMAVSHSVQITTSFAAAKVAGHDDLMSARLVFRSLFAPGAAALGADAIGFFTLWMIKIQTIQDMAIAAGAGTVIVTFTNLVLVKLLFSYFGISPARVSMTKASLATRPRVWVLLSAMATPRIATVSVIIGALMGVVAWQGSRQLQFGDLDDGAPELRPESRYNQDFGFISGNYSVSADILVVLVETPKDQCTSWAVLDAVDRFNGYIEEQEAVQFAMSMPVIARRVITGYNEGNPRWGELSKIQEILNNATQNVPPQMLNRDCSLVPVFVFMRSHRDADMVAVTDAVKAYAKDNDDPQIAVFRLAAGSVALDAATNDTIKQSMQPMLWVLYGVVILMCWITFNYSIVATICVIVPLALTSMLCEALMAWLGMGIKIGTLPVIALGVGIGVDYGIYIYSKMQEYLAKGMGVREAYLETLCITGKAVAFTGLTLALGVGTWIFSPIKFQADMGLLLTFMFIWNMVGAMWLLPALAERLGRLQPWLMAAKARLSPR